MNTADRVREMGLVVGDTIVGRDDYISEQPGCYHEAELTLLWVGEYVAVFRERSRNHINQDWCKHQESANWSLEYREWKKLPRADHIADAGKQIGE